MAGFPSAGILYTHDKHKRRGWGGGQYGSIRGLLALLLGTSMVTAALKKKDYASLSCKWRCPCHICPLPQTPLRI